MLYSLVAAETPGQRAAGAAASDYQRGLPRHVDKELDGFLQCGLLNEGFARVVCGRCRCEHLVAFSCKNRAICLHAPIPLQPTAKCCVFFLFAMDTLAGADTPRADPCTARPSATTALGTDTRHSFGTARDAHSVERLRAFFTDDRMPAEPRLPFTSARR